MSFWRGLDVKSGTVTGGTYSPAYTSFISTGDKGQVVPVYYPESYWITITGKTIEGEERQRSIKVDAWTFHQVKPGQKWTEEKGFQ